MWTKIAEGSIVLFLIGLVAKVQSTRITETKKDIEKKASRDICDQRYGELLNRLGRGTERFDKIDDKLDEHNRMTVSQGKLLVKIDTKLDTLNGGRKK